MLPIKTAEAEKRNILTQVLSSDFSTIPVPMPIQGKNFGSVVPRVVRLFGLSVVQIIQNSPAVMAGFAVLTDPHNFVFLADGVTVGSGSSELKWKSWEGTNSGP